MIHTQVKRTASNVTSKVTTTDKKKIEVLLEARRESIVQFYQFDLSAMLRQGTQTLLEARGRVEGEEIQLGLPCETQ